MGIAGRRGSAPIPQLAQGVFPLCPFNPAEIKFEEKNFLEYLSENVGKLAERNTLSSVVAISGIGSLYGIIRVSKVVEEIVKTVPIPGRLLVFFPGERDGKNYRLLKARDGWNYLATPIEAEEMD
ncbi:MAG: Uncharacterized protein XE10_1518 [Methanoculleus marisnigri]|uniref:DUF1788 domain-containing protein n=1 Tax=Methanoculleus marisnigri TaxID=2198 RepID=A0A101GMJ0_9EURY|nr:MAG: Uncharacterized protein XD82_1332 [Methanoculleus marisnigri]KUL00192.1 MAG: Uncharacterized protein XE10_1518 [Methanoculleus marisnigri]